MIQAFTFGKEILYATYVGMCVLTHKISWMDLIMQFEGRSLPEPRENISDIPG